MARAARRRDIPNDEGEQSRGQDEIMKRGSEQDVAVKDPNSRSEGSIKYSAKEVDVQKKSSYSAAKMCNADAR